MQAFVEMSNAVGLQRSLANELADFAHGLCDLQEGFAIAVVGFEHEIKGEGIGAYVIANNGFETGPEAQQELRAYIAKEIGPFARPDQVHFADALPKTRSGKIMRRLLRDVADGRALGDTTTLADPAVVDSLKEQYGDEE